VGRDLVNHCVNDILVYGAKPLFFLDYFACGRLDTRRPVFGGVGDSRRLPGKTASCCWAGDGRDARIYRDNEYDLAGFIVGLVEKGDVVDGRSTARGNLLIGLPSTGLHTNGYSLARDIVFGKLKLDPESRPRGLARTSARSCSRPTVPT